MHGPDEFSGPLGHIADASNMPVDKLPQCITEISALKDRPVILVSRTDKRSTIAATLLRDLGFMSGYFAGAWNSGIRKVCLLKLVLA